ncbi:MAG: c-type cytochrome [Rhodoferax sp.]|nr:c-type cytochrome [Rhodoferax sp.]
MKKTLASLCAAALLWVLVAEWVAPAARRAMAPQAAMPSVRDAAQVPRGAYLARLGNCAQCHTAPGAPAYAGGAGVHTPFGRVFGSNLTPHPTAGIGGWSAEDFWRAMHQGVGPNGRVLNPAFPYTSFTQISRADSDALFAYLRSLPASDATPPAHELPWPLGTQTALAFWRMLHFREADTSPPMAPGTAPSVARGAYLVQGLGHCAECHTPRNALGGLRASAAWRGATLPDGRWFAPALNDNAEGGLSDWPADAIATLLTHGQHRQAFMVGPMAEVVRNSTQYLEPADAQSMALYLQTLGAGEPRAPRQPPRVQAANPLGAKRYEQHCAQCHGNHGEGVQDAYPALAGNRAVLMDNTRNLVLVLLHGGYGPSTTGKPYPHGMPPYQFVLNDAEMASVLSFIRSSWGNQALPVTEFDINHIRQSTTR